jgi:hypothetical protein
VEALAVVGVDAQIASGETGVRGPPLDIRRGEVEKRVEKGAGH